MLTQLDDSVSPSNKDNFLTIYIQYSKNKKILNYQLDAGGRGVFTLTVKTSYFYFLIFGDVSLLWSLQSLGTPVTVSR